MAEQQTISKQSHEQAWPHEGLTRVPYRVFQTEESYRAEQRRIFHGPAWHYLALEVELPESVAFRTTTSGGPPGTAPPGSVGGIYSFDDRGLPPRRRLCP